MTHVSRRSVGRALGALVAAGVMAIPALAGAHTNRPASAASATVVGTNKIKGFTTVLAASNGHTLYEFDKDKRNKSACSGACANVWKPLLTAGSPTVKPGAGLNAKLLGTAKLSGGRTQVTYNGHPLYEYAKERKAGQYSGLAITQFGGDWYPLGPKGKPIKCNPNLVCTY